MGFSIVGLDFQCLPVMRDRLVDLSPRRQSVTEVVVGSDGIGRDFQRLLVVRDRLADPSLFFQSGPEVAVGCSAVRGRFPATFGNGLWPRRSGPGSKEPHRGCNATSA